MAPPVRGQTLLSGWASATSWSTGVPTRSGGGAAGAGDIIVAVVHWDTSGTHPVFNATGWTVIHDVRQSGTSTATWIAWRPWQSGDTGYTISTTGAVLTGMLSTTLIQGGYVPAPVSASNTLMVTTSAGTLALPSITPPGFDHLILSIATCGRGNVASTTTTTPPTGTTEVYDSNSGATAGGNLVGTMAAETMATGTATGTRTFTWTQNSSTRAGAIIAFVRAGVSQSMTQTFGVTTAFTAPGRVKMTGRILSFAVSVGYEALSQRILNRTINFLTSFAHSAAGVLERIQDLSLIVAPFVSALRGRRGPVKLTYRIMKSNIYGEELEFLQGVVANSATVSLSNFRDHTWELTFNWYENDQIDPVRDWVKVMVDIERGGKRYSWPLGLYRMKKPSGTITQSHTLRTLNGRSPEILLSEDMAAYGYSVNAGTGVLAAVRTILLNHAVPDQMISLPPTDVALRNTITFDPSADQTGSNWLAICNALLNAGGFYALQTTADGRFTTEKMGSRHVMAPSVIYDEIQDRFVVGEVTDNWDDTRFANRIVVRSQDVADTPPIVSVKENRNPLSQGSYDYLGRWVSKSVNMQTVASQADADTMAQAELEKASGYYRKLTLLTLPDPRRGLREIYELRLNDVRGEELLGGRWAVTSWSLPLSDPPDAMSHEISRVEEV